MQLCAWSDSCRDRISRIEDVKCASDYVAAWHACHVPSITRANRCCTAALLLRPGSARQAARRAPGPARHISAMTATTLSAVTCGQICFGAGMVYTAAGVSRAALYQTTAMASPIAAET